MKKNSRFWRPNYASMSTDLIFKFEPRKTAIGILEGIPKRMMSYSGHKYSRDFTYN